MPGTNPGQIRVAGHGHVLVAPLGSPVPADTAAAWDSSWHDLGYTDNTGVKFSKKDKIDKIESWQSATAVRHTLAGRDLTLKFTLLQVNSDTLPFFYGGGTVSDIGTGTPPAPLWQYQLANTPALDERMLAVEFTDTIAGAGTGTGAVKYRFILPRGQVTDTDEIALANTGAIKLGVTFEALETADGSPLATWLMNDPALA